MGTQTQKEAWRNRIRRGGELDQVSCGDGNCWDELSPLCSDRGIAAIVASAAAIRPELMCTANRQGRRGGSNGYGMARVPGGFMTVHAGWRGSGRERLSNTVLRYGLNLGERNRGERGPK